MEKSSIVYLSGNIISNGFCKEQFERAENFLLDRGYITLNPFDISQSMEDLNYEQVIQVHYRLIDICDVIFMISGWQNSKSANAELSYAKSLGKKVMYQDYYAPFRKVGESDEDSTKL